MTTKSLLCVCAFAGATTLFADEVELKDLPANIKAAVEKHAKGGEIDEIEVEEEDGKTEYEVEYTKGDDEWSIKLDAAGKLLELETEIEWKDAPEALKKAVTKELGAKVDVMECEKRVSGGVVTYEVEAEVGDDRYEMVISAAGKILEKEVEDESDHDENGGDE